HKLDSYYEIDLPTLIESDREDKLEIFKYFYLFFRKEAFVEDKRGNSFLDKIYDKSHIFSQELGENLKENIYEAIKLMAEGFLKFPQNELDPVEDIDVIHDSSLVYLYRMIFVLYAESEGRDLLDTKNRIYNQEYSLNTLKQEVCEELEKSEPKYREWQHDLWDDLEELFLLIDKGSRNMGIPEEDLYIPAYNGGLFRTEVDDDANEENVFLQENKVGDSYLAEVIDLLTRHESDNGKGRVFVDYSSLDIRHLGSIYEGLLEYHLNVAPEPMVAVKDGKEQTWVTEKEYDEDDGKIVEKLDEGDVYLTTDKGERKATGSYYTPEYVVQYIVENTLDPILKDIKEELLKEAGGNFADQFAERVFELKILDPAMGSGHFLTNVVDHLAKEIVNAHEKQAEEFGAETVDESHDIHWARRQVVQRCIYGVDLNPMAVELAKVSLWLRTLASQQPLAFLDHHLKTGNSLIGSDIEEIEELSSSSSKKEENLASLEDFGMTKKGTMEDLMKIYQDFIKIENQELKDIKEIEKKYHDFEHEPIKERLEAMANVHTAREFGLDIPRGAFEKMAKGIDDESSWKKIEGEGWFKEAQELAEEKNFFHWKLAYPETFYDEDGEEKKVNAGFNVVMGNPPYISIQQLSRDDKSYYNSRYTTAIGNYDIYVLFVELGMKSLNKCGRFGFILPNKMFRVDYGQEIRRLLSERRQVAGVIDFGSNQVFIDSATTYTSILFLQADERDHSFTYWKLVDGGDPASLFRKEQLSDNWKKGTFDNSSLSAEPWNFHSDIIKSLFSKVERKSIPLGDITKSIGRGTSTGDDDIFIVNKEEKREGLTLCTSSVEEDPFLIETALLRTPIHSTNFGKYRFTPHLNKKLIWPYDENSNLISEKIFAEHYPNAWEYLKRHKGDLENRADFSVWYGYSAPRNLKVHKEADMIIPLLAEKPSFAPFPKPQDNYALLASGGFAISLSDEFEYSPHYVLSIINSSLLFLYLRSISNYFRGGYITCTKQYFSQLPIHQVEFTTSPKDNKEKIDKVIREIKESIKLDKKVDFSDIQTGKPVLSHNILSKLADKMIHLTADRDRINLNIQDYLGNYSDGKTLGELYTPAKGLSDEILMDTAVNNNSLRIGCVFFKNRGNQLVLFVSARYKPENPEEHETDRWGYTETELIPAMKFTGSEKELALIREFTKLAVDKAGGFANFREKATKTMSILDRLEKLTLPKLSDVKDGLEKYLKQKEKAERLEEEIRETDHTIDAIVFDLYELDEEEVVTVLDSLDTPEDDKENILEKFREIHE
ncbi:MAG: N-6 DNA methylase, partial [Thermoplasmata archaeon]